MTRVFFHKTVRAQFERAICEQVLACHGQKRKALVLAANPAQAERLDALLWTWRQDSFIPHLIVDPLPSDAASWIRRLSAGIVTAPTNPMGATALVLAAAVPPEFLRGFEEAHDFVVEDDESAKAAARQRFRAFRDAGLDPHLSP